MKLWPDLPDSWEVQQIGNERRMSNLTDGVKAITIARQWHRDLTQGPVYVFTPRKDVYLVQDNGYTRIGF